MNIPTLSTKLYIPLPREKVVTRSRLIEQMNGALDRRLTLISASAGSGKTTLISEWVTLCGKPVAWLSLDEGDNDTARFLTYLIKALQTIAPNIGESVLGLLQSPQLPPMDLLLTTLLNDVTADMEHFVLVLDDYHVIKTETIVNAIAFLLEHMPPQMHLIIATRENPRLPLARFRVKAQLNEVGASDLRFNTSEADEFLRVVMDLHLSPELVTQLESRTEGWIAGLQLAGLSIQGVEDPTDLIKSFSGNHHFILDYLLEEVLKRQPDYIQAFLLHTSVLDRMCGSLCDAVLKRVIEEDSVFSNSGQETLEYLVENNLFVVPLDTERRWYRYHHLFGELLRQRLHHNYPTPGLQKAKVVSDLHIRASQWYEDNGHDIEAFQHAVSADDVGCATRLAEGEGMPLLFRGAVAPVLGWLNSLPNQTFEANPSLWILQASALLMLGQMTVVEEKLHAAQKKLKGTEQDPKAQNYIGHIAAIRATLAVSKHQTEIIMAESQRALENLHPDNLPVRTAATFALGYAHQLRGNRTAASAAYTEALSVSQRIGHVMMTIMSSLGLGKLQESQNHLCKAVQTYQHVLTIAGNPALPVACEAHLGLARIFYEWNNLEAARHHGEQAIELAKQLEHTDRFVAAEVFLARLKITLGATGEALIILKNVEQVARQQNFLNSVSEIASTTVLALLRQGNVTQAAKIVQEHNIQISQVRVHLTQGNVHQAMSLLQSLRRQAEEKNWADEQLIVLVLQSVALLELDQRTRALEVLEDALILAVSGGFIRIFVDEGMPMNILLLDAKAHGIMPSYVEKLLTEIESDMRDSEGVSERDPSNNPLIEPLSERELEVLHLIAQGLSNREICERLFLALSTVKGHNRIIFDKLQVKRRTEAVARARKLGLL
ncbi:transcriptional regulator [Paenibacillus sp. SSG-1]|uniref:LuxR C-terminal-related transcriptional regulator n=1 Tax=Paenibacillus sp. SSG-1 TaxID=1443669 RepID=UPI000B7D58A9|nr:LuxR C-terminal-related transcriptional regulator [Paenibacillus sp. SSG-1]OXL87585.1 transcriptional regulator [Paenibacillus sp. SSG-1]